MGAGVTIAVMMDTPGYKNWNPGEDTPLEVFRATEIGSLATDEHPVENQPHQ